METAKNSLGMKLKSSDIESGQALLAEGKIGMVGGAGQNGAKEQSGPVLIALLRLHFSFILSQGDLSSLVMHRGGSSCIAYGELR